MSFVRTVLGHMPAQTLGVCYPHEHEHVIIEKRCAATLRDADRMIAAAKDARRLLAINWPLRWYPAHVTARRLLREGRIGALQEVRQSRPVVTHRGQDRGLAHTRDEAEKLVLPETPRRWLAAGLPRLRHDRRHVAQGEDGTISSYDFEPTIRIQTRANVAGEDMPVDSLQPPFQNPIQYLVHCIAESRPIEGPLSPKIARIGEQIVDSAVLSARIRKTITLVERP